ncbi:MAG: hypothetical protein KDA24_17945 [Deltaproteobacteria bacterium]|nr:hypothetical protein [Deltaproteobacteria bacterium]
MKLIHASALSLGVAMTLLLPASSQAAGAETAEELFERFSGTSALFENTFSVAHGTNFDPVYNREWTQIRRLNLRLSPVDELSLSAGIGIQRFLFETWTTLENETLWEDLTLGATMTVPTPELPSGADFPLYGAFGVETSLPTSKASRAETLIVSPAVWGEGAVTVPLLDGWSWGYRFTAAPRIHEFTTYAYAAARPCSPSTGCSLGASTDTGWLNTKLQLTHGAYTSITTLKEMLSFTVSMDVVYGFLYDKSPSTRWSEDILSTPGNPQGGTPTNLTSSFIVDLTLSPHESFAVGVGLWTPGSFRPNGGWYNPIANRWTQVYVDLTFYPVEFGLGVASLAKNAAAKKAASTD